MDKSPRKQSLLVKLCSLFVFLVIASLGLSALYSGYAPERYTRFGYTHPLYGRDAYLFGVILITLSLTPLLLLAKSKQQATYLGIVLGMSLLMMIFGGIYLWR